MEELKSLIKPNVMQLLNTIYKTNIFTNATYAILVDFLCIAKFSQAQNIYREKIGYNSGTPHLPYHIGNIQDKISSDYLWQAQLDAFGEIDGDN